MAKEDRKLREREKRRTVILKSALKSFAKHGYHKCSMDVIAEEAELGKSTIYYYFKNKDELLISVLKEGLELLYKNMTDKWSGISSVREKIEAIALVSADFIDENPDYFRLYLYLSAHPRLKKYTGELLNPLIESKNKLFTDLFHQAEREKIIKPIPAKSLSQIYGTLVMGAGVFGHYTKKSDILRRMKLINEIFFEGILLKDK